MSISMNRNQIEADIIKLLDMSKYYISLYYQDQINKFIDAHEWGLAFETIIDHYYQDGHEMTPEVAMLVKNLSEVLKIELPSPKDT